MQRCAWRVALALPLAACGPSVMLVDDAATTSGTTGSVATTSPAVTTTTTTTTTTTGATTMPLDDTGSSVDDASSDGSDADDWSCNFIVCADGGGVVLECDLFAQNCPSGEKCMPWANDGGPVWNATRCSPLSPHPAHVGEPCVVEGSGVTGIDDCDVGLMCWNVAETGEGICEDMCTGSAELPICENPLDTCAIVNDGVIALCMQACDPLVQNCIVENEVCRPLGYGWTCSPDCSCGGLGVYGDPCEYQMCDEGNVCVDKSAFTSCSGTVGCCTTLCNLADGNADTMCQMLDAAQTCEPWYAAGQAPAGYENVGVCMIAG